MIIKNDNQNDNILIFLPTVLATLPSRTAHQGETFAFYNFLISFESEKAKTKRNLGKSLIYIRFPKFVQMKFITLLFNLYLLVLPCLPCADVDDCANENTTTLSYQKENNNKEEHKEDNCTPFCHCDCCITAYYYQINNTEKSYTRVYSTQKYLPLEVVFTSNKINTIWQPPKFIV